MFHRILVTVAQSEFDRQVFESAIALAQSTNASLLLLHVLSPFDESYPGVAYSGIDGMYPSIHQEAMQPYLAQWQQREKEGVEWLRSLIEQTTHAGVITDFTQNFGDPGRVICEVARTWEADLIMVGRRGRVGLNEFFLGSVSNYVLHHAPCSVLTVQPNQTAEIAQAQNTGALTG